jgi:EAL domain-containing protein (putative c-di-GMP-specific phosphodiesterase class I)
MDVRQENEAQVSPPAWPRRIREALDRDRFVLHAQPIVDLSSGETIRHELFLRMMEDHELIPAASFVVAAEEHGSIREIDRWVVATAIEAASQGRGVHVNLSVRSTDAELLELIRERLEASGADPSEVVFELGEEQLLEAGDPSREFVRGVSELGCGLALDKFVRSGDDLTLLEALPIDYLKIGPPFVHDLRRDPAARSVVESVVVLSQRFGQHTIAQGVEDVATLQTLRELGIDQAQGFALGAPLPLESVTGAMA